MHLQLSTSLSSKIQWSEIVLIQWNINPTCSGKLGYLADDTWDEYCFYKDGQFFSLHSLWRPTAEVPAQLAHNVSLQPPLTPVPEHCFSFHENADPALCPHEMPVFPVKINLLVDYFLLNGKRLGMSFSVSKPEWQRGCFLDEWRSLCMISGMRLSIHVGNRKLTSFAVRIRASPFAQGCWWRLSFL